MKWSVALTLEKERGSCKVEAVTSGIRELAQRGK